MPWIKRIRTSIHKLPSFTPRTSMIIQALGVQTLAAFMMLHGIMTGGIDPSSLAHTYKKINTLFFLGAGFAVVMIFSLLLMASMGVRRKDVRWLAFFIRFWGGTMSTQVCVYILFRALNPLAWHLWSRSPVPAIFTLLATPGLVFGLALCTSIPREKRGP